MSKKEVLVLTNYEISMILVDKIIKLKSKNCSYHTISFPLLTKILFNPNETLEKNYFFYMIKKMLILHPITEIIFLANVNNEPLLEDKIQAEFPNTKITIYAYDFSEKEIIFNDINKIFNFSGGATLTFCCTEKIISKMYVNSLMHPNNPLSINDGYCIRLPGSTLPLTLGEERKSLINIINHEIKTKKIQNITIEHHWNCETFKSYHQVNSNLNRKRSCAQHMKNIEKIWRILNNNEIELSSRYFELERKNKILSEWVFKLHDNGISEFGTQNIYNYNFRKFIVVNGNKK